MLVKAVWLCEFFSLTFIYLEYRLAQPLFFRCSGDNTGEVTIFNNVVI